MSRAPVLAVLLAPLLTGCGERAATLERAREAVGPEVSDARSVRLGDDTWVAAARPARGPAGAREIVLVDPEGNVVEPGLYAGPGDAAALWGVGDVEGDGDQEVWAAAVVRDGAAPRIDVRAYSPRPERAYRMSAPLSSAGPDSAQRDYSFNVADAPQVQSWLSARAAEAALAVPGAP